MKDSFELKVGPDGTIETIYQDGIEDFAKEMGAEVSTVCRASEVEWEEIGEQKGWTVRSAKDPHLALREFPDEIQCNRNSQLPMAVFPTREEALKWEIQFFWELRNG